MKRYIVAAGIAALGFAGMAHANGIQINEIRIDQTGSDTDEYFELVGTPGASLDGLWYIVIGDHSADQGAGGPGSRSGQVEYALNLTGSTIPADGFFLAASNTFGTALTGSVDLNVGTFAFENSDNVTHMLVSGFTGAQGDALDLGTPDGIIDVTPWSSVLDSISLIENFNPPATNADEFDYSGQFGPGIGPDGAFVPGHVYRSNDGKSPWAIGPFDIAVGVDTPGTSNVPTPGAFALLGVAGVAGLRRRR
ncbi:MAG: hypothetical protein H6814_11310 [Phycisphaeraceae bacterium]|nr:hypothetical protein [Phycisphaeraceae bacterium]